MLSKQQFINKHKSKFQKLGLGTQQIDARYRSYVQGFKNSSNNARLPKGSVNSANSRISNSARTGIDMTYSTMAECSKKYLTVICNPWAPVAGVCVPDTITIPSYKVSFFTRGTFTVGVNGTGWVSMNPYVCWGDQPWLQLTTNLYVSPDVDNSEINTHYDSVTNNSSFTQSQFTAFGRLRRRLVAGGIKARYIGAELTRSGRMVEFREPINESVFATGTNQTFATLLGNRETVPMPVDRQYHYAIWRPAVPEDTAYMSIGNLAQACLLIAVEGAPPGSTFEYDATAHFEIVGSAVPSVSKSEADVIGHSAIASVIAQSGHQPTVTPEQNLVNMIKEVHKTAEESTSFIGNVGKAVETVSSIAETILPVVGALL